MRVFKITRMLAVVAAISFAFPGVELLAQKGKGNGKGRGADAQQGKSRQHPQVRGGGSDRGRGRPSQVPQAGQHSPRQNRNFARGGPQPGQQQIRQAEQDRNIDRRAERQQRQQQLRQAIQDRNIDRRAQQQQRQQKVKQAMQNRNNDRRAEMFQRMQQARKSANGRSIAVERRNALIPQIIPQKKNRSRGWFPKVLTEDRIGRQVYSQRGNGRDSRPVRHVTPGMLGWPANYGQQRREEVHARNAQRRAVRDAERSWREMQKQARRDFRNDWRERHAWPQTTGLYQTEYRPRTFYESYVFPRYGSPVVFPDRYRYDGIPRYQGRAYNDYGYPTVVYQPYGDHGRPDAIDVLRNVIFAVLGGGGFQPYDREYAYAGVRPDLMYDPGYAPVYAGYDDVDYYSPSYSAVDPSYYDPYFYEDPYYSEVLPIQHFVSNAPGGDLFRQMFTQLLAIGYDQGYQDGVAARRVVDENQVFYDPYAYENMSYDPYSVSLGDNRRCLSQGYELGYQDAINNMEAYDQFDNGEVDLMSVLLGSVSQLI